MNICALTGAGISKASNIPTFEEMGDLRDKLSRSYFNRHPRDFYDAVLTMKDRIDAALPNEAHLALAAYRIPIVTMNIDGLHQRAGSLENQVLEVHGHLRTIFCPHCQGEYPFEASRSSLLCPACHTGILHPHVVLYGDAIPRLDEALTLATQADLLLIVGTSFYTSTAHFIRDAARSKGAQIKTINEDAEHQLPFLLNTIMEGVL